MPVMSFTTDKMGHGYFPVYQQLATELGPHARVCEIGVANGEGLVLFRALFPHGQLVGVDINPGANFRTQEENVTPVIMSQDNPQLAGMIQNLSGIWLFDMIVDDASHNNALTRATFRNMWASVTPGGYYVIEDWNHAGGLCFDLATELPVTLLREDDPYFPNVESITYRRGMIVMRKMRKMGEDA